ncbi:MAG: ATP-binding protein [Candidatus Nanoarchaeia archaeon]
MVVVIGMVGLPAAGKSTFAREISDKFNISHVNGDQIREYLINSINYFKSADYSHENPLINSVNSVVRPMSDRIIEELLSKGQNVIIDGYGKDQNTRDSRKKIIENFKPFLILIYVKEEQELILNRLSLRDKGKKTRWVENYKNTWLPKFSEPELKECNVLLTVTALNKEQILEQLKNILNDH